MIRFRPAYLDIQPWLFLYRIIEPEICWEIAITGGDWRWWARMLGLLKSNLNKIRNLLFCWSSNFCIDFVQDFLFSSYLQDSFVNLISTYLCRILPSIFESDFFYNIIFFRMFQNGKVCIFHKVSSCAFCALLKEIQMPSFLPFLFIHLPLELPSMPCLSISANWILLNLVADYTLKTQLPCTWMYRLTENVGADFFGF